MISAPDDEPLLAARQRRERTASAARGELLVPGVATSTAVISARSAGFGEPPRCGPSAPRTRGTSGARPCGPRQGDPNVREHLPGCALITMIRSERKTASSMSWVTKRTVLPISRTRRCSSACMSSLVCASRAPKGSSMNSASGSTASAAPVPRAVVCLRRAGPDSCSRSRQPVSSRSRLRARGVRPWAPCASRARTPRCAVRFSTGRGSCPGTRTRSSGTAGRPSLLRPSRRRRQLGQSVDDAKQGRLPAATRSDDRHELPGSDGEGHVVECVDPVLPAHLEVLGEFSNEIETPTCASALMPVAVTTRRRRERCRRRCPGRASRR